MSRDTLPAARSGGHEAEAGQRDPREAADQAHPRARGQGAQRAQFGQDPSAMAAFSAEMNFFQLPVSGIADPTLAEMGKNLKEAMKMLEGGQRRIEEEKAKKLLSEDIPGPLQGSGQDMVSILQLVQNLMYGDDEEEPQSPR
ncbi:Pyridoxal-dependent decarboxylase domain-containing protein 2 [Fukomys damarensis]|uniref:Pyridoxal-dependent decarboxylase domain-containing protein 2 n=1 Tax=Fukomys damarensis TaxID=885580 RepID=A0A091D7U8_FUKDA|nr:Pyridoxal-dependent decarboxylase domain-containing protein 2 [Fukomys damarensis]